MTKHDCPLEDDANHAGSQDFGKVECILSLLKTDFRLVSSCRLADSHAGFSDIEIVDHEHNFDHSTKFITQIEMK